MCGFDIVSFPGSPASGWGSTMALFFKGAITSSPIKTRNRQEHHSCHSFDASFLSDASYECFSINPTTGSACVCRRSPRLLANGYYVLAEDSVVIDDQGNLTLTPTQTNVSYKENLARIFRRRRKVRRSLTTLLSDVSQSCQSWLGGNVFGRADTTPPTELSSWLDVSSSTEPDTPICFTYDPPETVPSQQLFLPEVEHHTELCPTKDLPDPSLTCLMDVPPPSKYICKSYCPPTNPPPDGKFFGVFFLLILTLGLCAAVFSRWLFGGVFLAVAFLFQLSYMCTSKSGNTGGLSWTKTEDITSKNE